MLWNLKVKINLVCIDFPYPSKKFNIIMDGREIKRRKKKDKKLG